MQRVHRIGLPLRPHDMPAIRTVILTAVAPLPAVPMVANVELESTWLSAIVTSWRLFDDGTSQKRRGAGGGLPGHHILAEQAASPLASAPDRIDDREVVVAEGVPRQREIAGGFGRLQLHVDDVVADVCGGVAQQPEVPAPRAGEAMATDRVDCGIPQCDVARHERVQLGGTSSRDNLDAIAPAVTEVDVVEQGAVNPSQP